jgi:hypothetical protein
LQKGQKLPLTFIRLFSRKEIKEKVTLFSNRFLDSCAELNMDFLLLAKGILAGKLLKSLPSGYEGKFFLCRESRSGKILYQEHSGEYIGGAK